MHSTLLHKTINAGNNFDDTRYVPVAAAPGPLLPEKLAGDFAGHARDAGEGMQPSPPCLPTRALTNAKYASNCFHEKKTDLGGYKSRFLFVGPFFVPQNGTSLIQSIWGPQMWEPKMAPSSWTQKRIRNCAQGARQNKPSESMLARLGSLRHQTPHLARNVLAHAFRRRGH